MRSRALRTVDPALVKDWSLNLRRVDIILRYKITRSENRWHQRLFTRSIVLISRISLTKIISVPACRAKWWNTDLLPVCRRELDLCDSINTGIRRAKCIRQSNFTQQHVISRWLFPSKSLGLRERTQGRGRQCQRQSVDPEARARSPHSREKSILGSTGPPKNRTSKIDRKH